MKSIAVVVAQLVALMADQIRSLRAKCDSAVILSSESREGRVGTGFFWLRRHPCQCQFNFLLQKALIQDKWRNFGETFCFRECMCCSCGFSTVCLKKVCIRALYPISVAHLAYWLKPIGIASPDGENLIAIKFSNCAVQYKRNTSNKNPFYCPAILYYGIIRVRTFSRISLVNSFTEKNLRSNFSKLICE